ncbi:MAG: transglutaminase domain-containing protein [Saprospiraceae bacterium]|nr:transglutaminase domain-containing protein [Saprospiraceae bacterium]
MAIKMGHNKVLFSLVICLCFVFNGYSQVTNKDKIRIQSAEYELEFYLNDEDEVNAELRVFKKYVYSGIGEYGISESVFFDNTSEVKRIRKNGKKIKPIISDYQSRGIFHSDLKICYFEGSAYEEDIEISYTKVFEDIKHVDPFYFVDAYDVRNVKLTVFRPQWIDLNIVEWNFEDTLIEKIQKEEKDESIYTYTATNIELPEIENGKPSYSSVFPHLLFVVRSATIRNKVQPYMRDVGDLYKWYSGLVKEIGNDNTEIRSIVTDLLKGKSSDIEKIKSIYYWVQDNIRYVAFEYGIMGFQPESCQKVFKNKYGDCKGMANLTKEMLEIAGYDARLTWIGTNSLPYDYSIPSLYVDNHMICTVMLDGKPVFLDATEKFADMYHYASRIQGKQALIEDGDNYLIERVPVDVKANVEQTSQELQILDSKLVGSGRVELLGGRKVRLMTYLKSMPRNKREDYMVNYIGNGNKSVGVKLLEEIDLDNRDQSLELPYEIIIENQIIDLGSELYVNTETDNTFEGFEKIEDRAYPYNLREEVVLNNHTVLNIPTGYEVDYLPESVVIDNELCELKLSYKVDGDKINYIKEIGIKKKMIPVDYFEKWNGWMEQLKTFYSDQIIFKKL